MTRENPYTGVALRDEPAVAFLSLQNEDSLLFWTMDALAGPDRVRLHRAFGAWLAERYGSLSAAREHWGGAGPVGLEGSAVAEDDWSSGRIGVSRLWALTSPDFDQGAAGRRRADEAAFLAETMRAFHQKTQDFLRDELEVRHPINPGNWRTVDPRRLGDLERWTHGPGEVSGLNRYVTAPHTGENAGWAVMAGQRFAHLSVLLSPEQFPLAVRQPVGQAFVFPEGGWVTPNLYVGEGPFLVAAYQPLLGIDAYFWFSAHEEQWRAPSSANGFVDALGKWVVATPEIAGHFPGAALTVRTAALQRGEPAVVERRTEQALFRRQPPAVVEEAPFDPNRDRARTAAAAAAGARPFLVGPVRVELGASEDRVLRRAPAPGASSVVVSSTGEQRWDVEAGYAILDAPRAQGVAGFLGAQGWLSTADVRVRIQNPYATLLVVSMDGAPLSASRRILVQMGTVARPSGWQERAVAPDEAGTDRRIVAHGGAPWRVQALSGRLRLGNAAVDEAIVLDPNGRERARWPVERTGEGVELALPRDAKHVLLVASD